MMYEVKERHERSAIIGHWRNGATVWQIVGVTGMTSNEIYKIISEYLKEPDVEDHDEEININPSPNEKSTNGF